METRRRKSDEQDQNEASLDGYDSLFDDAYQRREYASAFGHDPIESPT